MEADSDRPPADRPLLLVDVDGVLSLFPRLGERLPARGDIHWINVEGIPHAIALDNCARLARLGLRFELVWTTGWEDKANDHLPALIGLDGPLEVISFDGPKYDAHAHWKLDAVEAFVGGRAAAWIDDAHDRVCREWASTRSVPTLLVDTDAHVGLDEPQVDKLLAWAAALPTG